MLPAVPLFAVHDLWYAVPLIVAVSLVYAATRHEEPDLIIHQSWRTGVWITGFMLIILLVLVGMEKLQ